MNRTASCFSDFKPKLSAGLAAIVAATLAVRYFRVVPALTTLDRVGSISPAETGMRVREGPRRSGSSATRAPARGLRRRTGEPSSDGSHGGVEVRHLVRSLSATSR